MALVGGSTRKGVVGIGEEVSDGGLSEARVINTDIIVGNKVVGSIRTGIVGTIVGAISCVLV